MAHILVRCDRQWTGTDDAVVRRAFGRIAVVAFDATFAVVAFGAVLAVEALARDGVAFVGVAIAVARHTGAQIWSPLHSVVSLRTFLTRNEKLVRWCHKRDSGLTSQEVPL